VCVCLFSYSYSYLFSCVFVIVHYLFKLCVYLCMSAFYLLSELLLCVLDIYLVICVYVYVFVYVSIGLII